MNERIKKPDLVLARVTYIILYYIIDCDAAQVNSFSVEARSVPVIINLIRRNIPPLTGYLWLQDLFGTLI